MKKKCLIIIVIMLFVILCINAQGNNTKFEIKVVDEEENPIENVKINFGTGGIVLEKNVYTNKNGYVVYEGQFDAYGTSMDAEKDGYYRSAEIIKYTRYDKISNKLFPYPYEIKLVLRKKKNPVPMYAKWTDWIKFSERNKKIGYDLEIGDWVHPYGKGKTTDFYLLSYLIVNDLVKDYVKIFFENDDGLIEISQDEQINDSEFKIKYQAPVDGYKKELLLGETHNKIPASGLTYDGRKKESQFILRTRTKLDENNNLISANYTALKNYNGSGYSINFTYFFNPDNQSRSLEFNGKNLFKDLNAKGMKKERWEK